VRRNLELKAVDLDPRWTRAAVAALGARQVGVLRQRDTYFHAVTGRLKLREEPPRPAELIAYARPDRREARVSRYHLVAVADHVALAEALADVLGVRVVVDKERELWRWREVRIHLDAVAGLGHFVELEAVLGPGDDPGARAAAVAELRQALRLDDDRLVPEGYAELLERAGRRPR
jgi:predicted adenylyl cyclase CyaB